MSVATSDIAGRSGPRAALGALRKVMREPLGAFAIVLVLLVLCGAIFADVIASADPTRLSPRDRFMAPSMAHLLGTDHLGRDLFSRVLHGARIALVVALGSTLASLVIGVALGLVAGYGPRWLDNIMILIFDAVKSFPTVMLALAFIALFGTSLTTVVAVVILVTVPGYARIIRTQTIAMKTAEYVTAAQSLGASGARILRVHILPNVIGPLLILASMDIPVVIAIEAGLSFLGLGVRPPTPSWGAILSDGFTNIRDSAWIVIAGGLPIIITTLGFTFLGETLRDIFDPRLKGR